MRPSFYRETALLSQVRHYQVHEGDRTSIHHPEYEATEVKLEIPIKDLPTLSPQELMRRLNEAAAQMAGKVSGHAFEGIRAGTESVGNA